MPIVTCPECGATVTAIPRDSTVEIKGRLDSKRCKSMSQLAPDGGHIEDPLECEAMEGAVEALLAALGGDQLTSTTETEGDSLAPWRAGRISRRQYERWTVSRAGEARAAGLNLKCQIRDLSPGGARLGADHIEGLAAGQFIVLNLDGYRALPAEVRHVDHGDDEAGVMFLHSIGGQSRLAEWLSGQQAQAPIAVH